MAVGSQDTLGLVAGREGQLVDRVPVDAPLTTGWGETTATGPLYFCFLGLCFPFSVFSVERRSYRGVAMHENFGM